MRGNVLRYPLVIALAAFAALIVWASHDGLPPSKPADAPANEFSATRAIGELKMLLADERPHPAGSAANEALRARLIGRLEAMGLEPTTQTATGCSSKWPACGRVTNVLASLPGRDEDTILLMSHYDSVGASPGAGDAGAGVATLLEAARLLKARGSHKNTVTLLFTDAEEDGLLGAEAFFAEHPLAKRVKPVFNLEGHGTTGAVLLLRPGPESGHLVRAYRASSGDPRALSFIQEVFKRMPNDTDFSVAMRAGLPGIDFAFSGEVGHYHTPLDSIAMLSPQTVQHYGDSLLPLVERLLDADLRATSPNFVFASQLGDWWLSWSAPVGVALAALAIVLLAFATWRRRGELSALRVLGGLGVALLLIVATILIELAVLWVADQLAGTRVAWPADPLPWRFMIYAAPVLTLASLAPLLSRRLDFWSAYLGCWWLWGAASLAIAVYLPLASHLLLPSTLLAAVAAAAAPTPHNPRVITLVTAFVAGYFVLPLSPGSESTQGFALAPVIFTPLAWLATALIPLFAGPRVEDARPVLLGATAALIVGLVWVSFVPLYSEERPQHVTFVHQLDVDAGTARYVALSPNPLPQAVRTAVDFAADQPEAPWSRKHVPAAPAPMTPSIPPELISLDDRDGDTRTRRFVLKSHRAAHRLTLAIPKSAGIRAIVVEGKPVGLEDVDSDNLSLAFANPPPAGFLVDVSLEAETPVKCFLVDMQLGLPESANGLIRSRGPFAVPAHMGDRSVIYRGISF